MNIIATSNAMITAQNKLLALPRNQIYWFALIALAALPSALDTCGFINASKIEPGSAADLINITKSFPVVVPTSLMLFRSLKGVNCMYRHGVVKSIEHWTAVAKNVGQIGLFENLFGYINNPKDHSIVSALAVCVAVHNISESANGLVISWNYQNVRPWIVARNFVVLGVNFSAAVFVALKILNCAFIPKGNQGEL